MVRIRVRMCCVCLLAAFAAGGCMSYKIVSSAEPSVSPEQLRAMPYRVAAIEVISHVSGSRTVHPLGERAETINDAIQETLFDRLVTSSPREEGVNRSGLRLRVTRRSTQTVSSDALFACLMLTLATGAGPGHHEWLDRLQMEFLEERGDRAFGAALPRVSTRANWWCSMLTPLGWLPCLFGHRAIIVDNPVRFARHDGPHATRVADAVLRYLVSEDAGRQFAAYQRRKAEFAATRVRPAEPRSFPPPIAQPARYVQAWAVIVGVSRYRHAGVEGLKDLRFAARDAQRLHERLVGGDRARWPKENVVLLTDEKATRETVAGALLGFLRKAQKDDLVLIFFSGHGAPDPGRPKNTYFLCHDTDPRRLAVTGLPMWEIDNAIERGIIEARRVVLLADACHSGGFAPEGMKDIAAVSRRVSVGIQGIGKAAVRRVVTSCEPGETSRERAEWGGGHGAFAWALIQGLAGAADLGKSKNSIGNSDGCIDLNELVHYVRREVGDMTGNAQHVRDAGRLNAVLLRH